MYLTPFPFAWIPASPTENVPDPFLVSADPATTRHLISTFDQYGRPPNFYQQVITMADASELNADALTLFAECTAKYLGEGVSCGDREAAAKSDFSYDSLMQQFKQ